jgi:hypothetical protein
VLWICAERGLLEPGLTTLGHQSTHPTQLCQDGWVWACSSGGYNGAHLDLLTVMFCPDLLGRAVLCRSMSR